MQIVHCLKQKHIQAKIITNSLFCCQNELEDYLPGFEDCLKILKIGLLRHVVTIRADNGEDDGDSKKPISQKLYQYLAK